MKARFLKKLKIQSKVIVFKKFHIHIHKLYIREEVWLFSYNNNTHFVDLSGQE